jgi:hypothetical protein
MPESHPATSSPPPTPSAVSSCLRVSSARTGSIHKSGGEIPHLDDSTNFASAGITSTPSPGVSGRAIQRASTASAGSVSSARHGVSP